MFSTLFPFFLYAQSDRWQQKVDIDIKVSLDDRNNTLDANETIYYTNNSNDTLGFIWFHVWPNAFKNDRTAFSEQMVDRLDDSRFYFSDEKDRGYLNRLSFRVDGQTAQLQDDPNYIDVIKLVLPRPLMPGGKITITTPFHVKLPEQFSGGGHVGQSYQVSNWFPKPAVYDRTGWHPMPYLEQGGLYSDFGDYDVAITLPENYVVASTGELLDKDEKAFLNARGGFSYNPPQPTKKKDLFTKKPNIIDATPPSSETSKTLHFKATNVNDFAWFADKRFIVRHDTVSLPLNPHIDIYNFSLPSKKEYLASGAKTVKNALAFYSGQIGAYPYTVMNIIFGETPITIKDRAYPNVSFIGTEKNRPQTMEKAVVGTIGQDWFHSIVSANPRDHAWMEEGIGSYFEARFWIQHPLQATMEPTLARNTERAKRLLGSQIAGHRDQPLETESENLTKNNYSAVAGSKGRYFMEGLERELGSDTMQKVMQRYFLEWRYGHPYPGDLKMMAETVSGKKLDATFGKLYATGYLDSTKKKTYQGLAVAPKMTGLKNKDIVVAPALGYNDYDHLMVGALVINGLDPVQRFRYLLAPMYALGSKQFNYLGGAYFTFYPKKVFYSIVSAITVSRFSTTEGSTQDYSAIYKGFSKIEPSIRFTFREKSPVSNIEKWIEIKSFLITEGSFKFPQRVFPQDTFSNYAVKAANLHRSVNQIGFNFENSRHLYPYRLYAELQQAGDVLRATVTGNYFFNFNEKKQGMAVRLFAGKLFYTKTASQKVMSDNSRYDLVMYGSRGFSNAGGSVNYGSTDYTYSNAFIDRNQNQSFAGRQVMIKDGGFKYRSDYNGSAEPGRSNDWLVAANFGIDVPNGINPLALLHVPLKVFADLGTSAPAWVKNSSDPKFLYTVGLQLPILKYLNLYWAIFQSSAFDAVNSTNGGGNAAKWWQKSVTFSIDIQDIKNSYVRQPFY